MGAEDWVVGGMWDLGGGGPLCRGLCSRWFGHLGLCCVHLRRVCQAPRGRREKQETWALW